MCSGSWIERVRAALEEARGEDLVELGDEAAEAALLAVEGVRRAVEAERLRRLGDLERRRSFRKDGQLSATDWAALRLGLPRVQASAEVKTARSLEDMPGTREALARGEISPAAAGVLARARDAAPEAFFRAEGDLVAAARDRTVEDLSSEARRWTAKAAAGRAREEAEERRRRRRLALYDLPDGMVKIDGLLDPETGRAVQGRLERVARSLRTGADPRTGPQLLADALAEVCRGEGGRPGRPAVLVVAGLEALEGRAPGGAEVVGGGPISPDRARRLACDAGVARVLTRGRSEVVDLGRLTPVVSAALRRVLAARDGRCRFPGCRRPPEATECHHRRHWVHGGETTEGNCCLLCPGHHDVVHDHRVAIVEEPGAFVFRWPDGRELRDPHPTQGVLSGKRGPP